MIFQSADWAIKPIILLTILWLALSFMITTAAANAEVNFASAIFRADGLPQTLAGGMPVTFIKFRDQPSTSKVLAVTVAHWLEPEIQRSGEARRMYQRWDVVLPNEYLENWIQLRLALLLPTNSFPRGFQDENVSYLVGPWMHERFGVDEPVFDVRVKPLIITHEPADLLVLEFDISYADLQGRFNIVPFLVQDTTPEPGQIYHFTNLYGRDTTFCSFEKNEPSRVVETAGGNSKTLEDQLVFVPIVHLPSDLISLGSGNCSALAQTSGSSVLSVGPNEILGVISAAKFSDPNLTIVTEMLTQPLAPLRRCFDAKFNFNPKNSDCKFRNSN